MTMAATKWIRVLQPVAGDGFSWKPGDLVELPAAQADAWCDGTRAEAVRTQPRQVAMSDTEQPGPEGEEDERQERPRRAQPRPRASRPRGEQATARPAGEQR